VTTTNDPSSLVAPPPVVKLTGPEQQHDSSLKRASSPITNEIEVDQLSSSSNVLSTSGDTSPFIAGDFSGPSTVLAKNTTVVLGHSDLHPGPLQTAPTLSTADLNPRAPAFVPPTRSPTGPDLPTPVPMATSLDQPQGLATGTAALPPRLLQPGAVPHKSSDASLTQRQFSESVEPTRTHSSYLTSSTPTILRKKMKGKTLHFLVRRPGMTTSTWISATSLPTEAIAAYMTKAYAARQRKRSRRMAQFGQR